MSEERMKLITWNPETAKKAHAALEAAGVLCDMVLEPNL